MIPSAPLGTDAAAGPLGLGAATGPHGAGLERRFRFELAAHPGSPAQARRLARARLTGWAVCEDTVDTAALVISELVTNAIVHTASTVVACELQDGDDTVRIAVRDEGCAPTEPHPCSQRTEEEQGRGLLLVQALCRSWGAMENGTGLLVWAELTRGADEPRDDLGWVARPKPGSSQEGSEEDGETESRHCPGQGGSRGDESTGHHSPARGGPGTGEPHHHPGHHPGDAHRHPAPHSGDAHPHQGHRTGEAHHVGEARHGSPQPGEGHRPAPAHFGEGHHHTPQDFGEVRHPGSRRRHG